MYNNVIVRRSEWKGCGGGPGVCVCARARNSLSLARSNSAENIVLYTHNSLPTVPLPPTARCIERVINICARPLHRVPFTPSQP